MNERHAHIETDLLQQNALLPWSNLGLWKANDTYTQAATHLAQHLATQSGLKPSDTLLDVGCGYGASLDLWQHMGIHTIIGVEQQTACVTHIQQHSHLCVYQIDMQHAATLLSPTQFDVVLAIDVAYQWSLSTWLTQAQSVLKTQGRLGFHTLLQNPHTWPHAKPWQKYILLRCLKTVGVKTLHTPQSLQDALEMGFTDIQQTDLSESVLKGFGNHAKQLPLDWQNKPLGSLKIALTGRLCRYLYQSNLVNYVAVSAYKR